MKHANRGFTLIELMTAVMVLGILFAMALPSYRTMTRSNGVSSAQNDLLTALTIARSEALHRSLPVTVCASTNSTTCSGGTDWSSGWIAFTDDNGAAGSIDAGDVPLQKWTVTSLETRLIGTSPFVRYTLTGMTTPSTAKSVDVYFTSCVGAKLRRVAISAVGSTTASTQNCP